MEIEDISEGKLEGGVSGEWVLGTGGRGSAMDLTRAGALGAALVDAFSPTFLTGVATESSGRGRRSR